MNQADALAALHDGIARLTPSWQNPERFHEAKSELLSLVRALPEAAASEDVTDRIARARITQHAATVREQGARIRELDRQVRALAKAVSALGKARTPKRKRDHRQVEMIER